MWHHLLLICSLVSNTVGQNSINYLMLAPAEIHFPSTETACVDISGARENVTVRIIIQQGVHDKVILRHSLTKFKLFTCVQFQAPCPNKRTEEVLTIHISIVGPTTNLSESKKMLVRLMGSFTMIHSDKPIYTPGQVVNIRVLSFNREFLAVNDICPLVAIQDPNRNQIAQWVDLIPNNGIISISFELDSDAPYGVYKIISPQAKEEFHVSDYTIPKFAVKVLLPSVVTLLEKSFPLKICGRYTIKKNVQGKIRASVCREAICFYWMAHNCPLDLCTEYSGQTDRNGCLEIEVQTEPYDLRSNYYHMQFKVEASFVEAGTDVQRNATDSCRISALIAKVTFEETETSDSYYKPNLRYKAKIKLESADGSPMRAETLYLNVQYNKVTDEYRYLTDNNGEACITLNSTPWNGHTVYLKAYYKKNNPDRNYLMLNPYYKEAIRVLNPFTHTTSSYLKIQPVDSVLTCDQEYPIEIDFILRGSELTGNEETLDIRYVVSMHSNVVITLNAVCHGKDGILNESLQRFFCERQIYCASEKLAYSYTEIANASLTLIVARGNLVLSGNKEIKISRDTVMMDTLELRLFVTANLAPTAHILAYALLSNRRIVADTEVFQISKCFSNKVTLAFSEQEVTPGSQATLHVNAQPGSMCSIRAVDEGVLLLRPESELTSDAVYRFLAERNRYGYPYTVREDDHICQNPRVAILYRGDKRRKRSLYLPPFDQSSDADVFMLIQRIGMKVLTSAKIKKLVQCRHFPPIAALMSHHGSESEPYNNYEQPAVIEEDFDDFDNTYIQISVTVAEMIKRIRDKFPETLAWKLVTIGDSGQADIEIQVPHSITQWKCMAFCMGDAGLGIATPTSLTVLQPFFALMSLPFSVVRNEHFKIMVSVFSYETYPMMITVRLHCDPGLEVKDCSNCSNPRCLHPEESLVITWDAHASVSASVEQIYANAGTSEIEVNSEAIYTEEQCGGEKPIVPDKSASDTIVRTVIIKAEGIPVKKSHNSLLCGGDLSTETISITLPPGIVPNSAHAEFLVVGDIMGPALKDSDKLLAQPYGCGELNMVTFVPMIYVMNYLKNANLMTEEIQQRGNRFIQLGVQRQTQFRRQDGSFSAFGERDEEGNVRLTAFTMKAFHAASQYAYVNGKIIEEAGEWLKQNQLPNGTFRDRGKHFKQSLKGGVNDEVTLAAFIVIAFSEVDWPKEDEVIQNTLQYLRSCVPVVDSPHTKAMLAYTFTLLEIFDIRNALLQELHEIAVTRDGETHWPADPTRLPEGSLWSSISYEVELASYMVLAHLSVTNPQKKDITECSSIIKWLVGKQQAYGGFENTKDTVLAFQALALYSQMTYNSHEGLEVILSAAEEDYVQHFHVNEETKFLHQRRKLPKIPGNYTVQVKGKGCAFLQTTMKYNVYDVKVRSVFDVQINVTCENQKQIKSVLNYTFSVRYTGPGESSNMVIAEIELPSCFTPNEISLEEGDLFIETVEWRSLPHCRKL
ncbi:alpha-2-macroglobulin-like protein 1 [Gastrophryne carolinensis]